MTEQEVLNKLLENIVVCISNGSTETVLDLSIAYQRIKSVSTTYKHLGEKA